MIHSLDQNGKHREINDLEGKVTKKKKIYKKEKEEKRYIQWNNCFRMHSFSFTHCSIIKKIDQMIFILEKLIYPMKYLIYIYILFFIFISIFAHIYKFTRNLYHRFLHTYIQINKKKYICTITYI